MKKISILIIISVFLSYVAYSREMGMEEVLKELYRNNSEIKTQELEVESKALEVKTSLKRMAPGINLRASTDVVEDKNNYDAIGPDTISLRAPIFAGGALMANYNKIKHQYLEEEADLALLKNELEVKAISLYFDILNANKQLLILEETGNKLDQQKKRVEILFNNGKMVSKNELLEIQASILSLENDKLRAKNNIKKSKSELLLLLGLPMNSDINFIEKDINSVIFNPNLDNDLNKTVNQGSKAKKLDSLKKQAEEDIKIAKAEFYPKLDVRANYKYASTNDRYDDTGYSVSLVADMNVFQWGASKDNLKMKKMDLEQREMMNKKEMDKLKLDLLNKHNEIQVLENEIQIAEERRNILEDNVNIQGLRFRNGMVSSLDYLESVNLFQKSEEKKYSLHKELYLAQKEYNNLLK